MKTFKIIIAWLDWSSYCIDWNYERPKTLCHLFWRTLFTVITFPITYIAHVFNLFASRRDFWYETSMGTKMHMGSATLIHLIIILLGGTFLKEIIDGNLGWDWIRMSDSIWVTYPKMLVAGTLVGIMTILALGAIIAIGYGIWYLGKSAYDKIREYTDNNSKSKPKPKTSLIVTAYKSIKDKYCQIIDWSDVKES